MTIAEDLEVGRLTGSPDGVMNEEVSMKKINNKKTISVIDDILKVESTLYFELIFIFLVLGATQ
jgi:hypothetical protein